MYKKILLWIVHFIARKLAKQDVATLALNDYKKILIENSKMTEALETYANHNSWKEIKGGDLVNQNRDWFQIGKDGWEIAESVLKEIRNG